MIAKCSTNASEPDRRRKRPAMNTQQLRTRLSQSFVKLVMSPFSGSIMQIRCNGRRHRENRHCQVNCKIRRHRVWNAFKEGTIWDEDEDEAVDVVPSHCRGFAPTLAHRTSLLGRIIFSDFRFQQPQPNLTTFVILPREKRSKEDVSSQCSAMQCVAFVRRLPELGSEMTNVCRRPSPCLLLPSASAIHRTSSPALSRLY